MVMMILLPISTLHALPAVTQGIPVNEISDYKNYSPIVKNLISKANAMIEQNLTYQYGSADPKNKGMDCSGTIYYLLKNTGVADVPRQSNEMYTWTEQQGKLFKPPFNSMADLKQLQPGDLLFWMGTYNIKRVPPITHVMMYIGKNTKNKYLMFGASDGRTYQNKKMWGVSVFDFKIPDGGKGKFMGYSCVPHLTCPSK